MTSIESSLSLFRRRLIVPAAIQSTYPSFILLD